MKSATYLSNLTPLRGIAAILTVIFHEDLFLGGALVPVKYSSLLTHMYLMVDFFFILSGFILCHVYGKYFAESVSRKEFKKFSIARFARVYPLHFVTLSYLVLFYFVAAKMGIPSNAILQVDNSGYSILTNIFLLQSMNLHSWFTWVHASWSISTEWWAYMLFPFLVKPFSQLGNSGKLIAAILCFVGYFGIAYYVTPTVGNPFGWPNDTSRTSINVAYQWGYLRCLCGFILGMVMYYGYKEEWAKKILGNGYTMVLLGAGVFLTMHFFVTDLLVVSFFPFILLSGAYGSKNIDRFFALTPLQRIGDWSFSIYLVHQPIIITSVYLFSYFNPAAAQSTAPPELIPAWTIAIIFIGIILFFSWLTYRFWELPARQWINAKAGKTLLPVTVSNK